MNNDNVRMIDEYEVINSIHIGDKELVLCENMNNADGQYYMTCEVERNELFEMYSNALSSNSFTDIAGVYAERLKEQISKTAAELEAENVPLEVITAEKCLIDNFAVDMEGKILVINPNVLRAEYRTASHQIMKCTGGNGARAKALGSAVFGDLMATDKQMRYERCDILGELKPEHYPEWLTEKLQLEELIKSNPLTFEYGGYHFLPVGVINRTKTHEEISKKIASDKTMGIWSASYNKIYGKSKVEYTHKGFYSACGNIFCDVFKCLENGKYYMPGVNEIFLYEGKFKPYTEAPHKTKGKKEVER